MNNPLLNSLGIPQQGPPAYVPPQGLPVRQLGKPKTPAQSQRMLSQALAGPTISPLQRATMPNVQPVRRDTTAPGLRVLPEYDFHRIAYGAENEQEKRDLVRREALTRRNNPNSLESVMAKADKRLGTRQGDEVRELIKSFAWIRAGGLDRGNLKAYVDEGIQRFETHGIDSLRNFVEAGRRYRDNIDPAPREGDDPELARAQHLKQSALQADADLRDYGQGGPMPADVRQGVIDTGASPQFGDAFATVAQASPLSMLGQGARNIQEVQAGKAPTLPMASEYGQNLAIDKPHMGEDPGLISLGIFNDFLAPVSKAYRQTNGPVTSANQGTQLGLQIGDFAAQIAVAAALPQSAAQGLAKIPEIGARFAAMDLPQYGEMVAASKGNAGKAATDFMEATFGQFAHAGKLADPNVPLSEKGHIALGMLQGSLLLFGSLAAGKPAGKRTEVIAEQAKSAMDTSIEFLGAHADNPEVQAGIANATQPPLAPEAPAPTRTGAPSAELGGGTVRPRPPVSPELPEQAPRIKPAAEQAGVGASDKLWAEYEAHRDSGGTALEFEAKHGIEGSQTISDLNKRYRDKLDKTRDADADAAFAKSKETVQNPENATDAELDSAIAMRETAAKATKEAYGDAVDTARSVKREGDSAAHAEALADLEVLRAEKAKRSPTPPPKEPVAATVGKGGEPPKPPAQPKATKQPPKGDLKTTKQAEVKAAADAIGLDLTKEGKTLAQIAKEVEDGGHVSGANHAAEKALRGEALNTQEQVGLGLGVNNLKRQIKELDAAIRKAKKGGDEAATVDLLKRRADLAETHANLLSGLYRARSESGRSLGSGKWFDLADYAVKEDVVSMAEAKTKRNIPESFKKELEADSGRYAEQEAVSKAKDNAIKDSRAREASIEKRAAEHALNRAPRASRNARVPKEKAIDALKELGAFEPVVGAVPILSSKQSRALSILSKWAVGELENAGLPVTAETIATKMRGIVEKNNIGHVLFDEDYYRAIRQSLTGDKSGSYTDVLDNVSAWIDRKAEVDKSTSERVRKEAQTQGDWDKAFADAQKQAERAEKEARRNDILDAFDAAPRNRNAEKLAQAIVKGGTKDFDKIVKTLTGKFGISELDAAASARRAVYSLELGIQRRFGKDLANLSVEARQARAELEAIRKEIDYKIEKLTPQNLPQSLRVGLRAFAFSNPVSRALDVTLTTLRYTAEAGGKPVDSLLETAWMKMAKTDGKRITPQLRGMFKRSIEANPETVRRMVRDFQHQFKFGDTALLEKQGFPKVGMNTNSEGFNKAANFFARFPGYTDIPFKARQFEISLLEHVDNEVKYRAAKEGWGPAEAAQYRKRLLDNADGELYAIQQAAANSADEMVYANTTEFDKLITAGEKGIKSIGPLGDWVLLGLDVFVTPYARIFAKITGAGTDYVYGLGKAAGTYGMAKSKSHGAPVPAHVRQRVIQLARRNLFGLAIGYAAYEFNKHADNNAEAKDWRDRLVKLDDRGFVDFPELANAGSASSPFLYLLALHKINTSGKTESQKAKWRLSAFSSLFLDTPLASGVSESARAATLKEDPTRFVAKKMANAVIPGAVRQAARWFDQEPGTQAWQMKERDINTKPDPSKPWVEQDFWKKVGNEFKARIPGVRNTFPSKSKS